VYGELLELPLIRYDRYPQRHLTPFYGRYPLRLGQRDTQIAAVIQPVGEERPPGKTGLFLRRVEGRFYHCGFGSASGLFG